MGWATKYNIVQPRIIIKQWGYWSWFGMVLPPGSAEFGALSKRTEPTKSIKIFYWMRWQCVKTLYPCSSHQNSWDLWMFIPLKMYLSVLIHSQITSQKKTHNPGLITMGQNTWWHTIPMDVMYGYIRREQSLCLIPGHFDGSLPIDCCLTPVFDG